MARLFSSGFELEDTSGIGAYYEWDSYSGSFGSSNSTVQTATKRTGSIAFRFKSTVSATLPTANLGARVLTTQGGPFIPLAVGDMGMRQIVDVTWSAANTGLHAFLLVKPLCLIPTPIAGIPTERDLVMQMACLEQVIDGACLTFLVYFGSNTASNFTGELHVAWG